MGFKWAWFGSGLGSKWALLFRARLFLRICGPVTGVFRSACGVSAGLMSSGMGQRGPACGPFCAHMWALSGLNPGFIRAQNGFKMGQDWASVFHVGQGEPALSPRVGFKRA